MLFDWYVGHSAWYCHIWLTGGTQWMMLSLWHTVDDCVTLIDRFDTVDDVVVWLTGETQCMNVTLIDRWDTVHDVVVWLIGGTQCMSVTLMTGGAQWMMMLLFDWQVGHSAWCCLIDRWDTVHDCVTLIDRWDTVRDCVTLIDRLDTVHDVVWLTGGTDHDCVTLIDRWDTVDDCVTVIDRWDAVHVVVWLTGGTQCMTVSLWHTVDDCVVWLTGGIPSLSSLHVVTQSDSLTQYEKVRKEQQLTSTPQQVTFSIYLPQSDWQLVHVVYCVIAADNMSVIERQYIM